MRRLSIWEKTCIQYGHSPLLRQLARQTSNLRAELANQKRLVIPVTVLAREFGVSTRLLWNWIAYGLLTNQPKLAGSARLSRGIKKSIVLKFLKRLEDFHDDESGEQSFASPAGRKASAQAKIEKFYRLMPTEEETKPREFAELSGVSRSSVHRAIGSTRLPAYRRTPHRFTIGIKKRKKVS